MGKTAVAEAVAQLVVSENVPWKLRGKEIFLLDLTSLVAGTQFRGQFEEPDERTNRRDQSKWKYCSCNR